jgi:hypothetical protein
MKHRLVMVRLRDPMEESDVIEERKPSTLCGRFFSGDQVVEDPFDVNCPTCRGSTKSTDPRPGLGKREAG